MMRETGSDPDSMAAARPITPGTESIRAGSRGRDRLQLPPVKYSQALQTYAGLSRPTARCRQAVGRGPLIRLPDAAIVVRRLRVAVQVVHGARRGRCCARLSA